MNNAEAGYLIAVFQGGQALYVIRPEPEELGRYRFVGSATYVDGMMGLQVSDIKKKKEMDISTIVSV